MANAQQGGASATLDEFIYGIQAQESGGNYKAVNGGSGALGKYQIMPANVPSWSKKYMGTSWSPQQFLADPAKQDALAKAVLSDYYQKWGPRGAASAWYSGNPALNLNYNSQNGGPSIGSYVDQVLGKAMGFPGTPGTAYSEIPPTVTTVDKTVKDSQAPLALPGSAGVGAVSAPGVDALTASGMGAVTADGAEAFTGQPTRRPRAASGTTTPAGANVAATGLTGPPDPRGEASLMPDTIAGRRAILGSFPGLTVGGFRSGADAQDHGVGKAIDVMVGDPTKGQAIANFTQQAAGQQGWGKQVSYVIWQQHIWSPARASEGWRPMADRGSPTANHMDHVHVSFT